MSNISHVCRIPAVTMEQLLQTHSPFHFDDDERRESGNTVCRTLEETARAFDAWCGRYPIRERHPLAFGYAGGANI